MKSFVGEKENFVMRPNGSWRDVLPGFSVDKNPGSRVLDGFTKHPNQDSAAVIQTGGGESMNENFGH